MDLVLILVNQVLIMYILMFIGYMAYKRKLLSDQGTRDEYCDPDRCHIKFLCGKDSGKNRRTVFFNTDIDCMHGHIDNRGLSVLS